MRVLSDLKRDARDDSGAVLIWVGAMVVVLMGMAAFAVDLGQAYAVKRQLSVVADGAALAGAQEAGLKYKTLGGPTSALESAAIKAAQDNYALNVPQGAPTALPASAVDVDFDTTGGKFVTVTVNLDSTIATSFGQVLGVSSMNPGASATAQVFGTSQLSGLRPFTVCLTDATQAAASGGTHQSVYKNHNGSPDGSCNPTGAPGNWGFADFGQGNSDKTIVCLILNGFPGYDKEDCKNVPNDQDGVNVGAPPPGAPATDSPGYPGNSIQGNPNTESADIQALNSIVGQTILLPIAGDTSWDGSGNNATYDGMGAIAAEFCGWAMPKNSTDMGPKNTSGGCWDQAVYNTDAATWLTNQDVPSLVIQWRYTNEWVTSSIGQGSSGGCALGDPTCIPALSLIK